MNITPEAKAHQLVVYLPDTRGVTVSRFGRGNLKIGFDGVYTYSRLPGTPDVRRWNQPKDDAPFGVGRWRGTCPGSTAECESICYAKRVDEEGGAVQRMWTRNSWTEDVPDVLPPDARLVRLHISGDFTSEDYIDGWSSLALTYPEVRFWAYTRSWRVPELLPALEYFRAMPNVQLFASMDVSTPDLPPVGWRRAWIDGDPRAGVPLLMKAHGLEVISKHNLLTYDGARSYVCPEETGRRVNCEECRYCIDGKRNDVTFLKH